MMNDNIFKNAFFSKRFLTRDNRIAVYLGDTTCWIEGEEHEHTYSRNGRFAEEEHGIDIVAELKLSPLKDYELRQNAKQYAHNKRPKWKDFLYQYIQDAYYDGYKAGFNNSNNI